MVGNQEFLCTPSVFKVSVGGDLVGICGDSGLIL